MVIDLIVILIFGAVGYYFAQSIKPNSSKWMNVILVVLLVLAANIHSTFIGTDEFQIYLSAILQGIFGGVLIRRLKPKTA